MPGPEEVNGSKSGDVPSIFRSPDDPDKLNVVFTSPTNCKFYFEADGKLDSNFKISSIVGTESGVKRNHDALYMEQKEKIAILESTNAQLHLKYQILSERLEALENYNRERQIKRLKKASPRILSNTKVNISRDSTGDETSSDMSIVPGNQFMGQTTTIRTATPSPTTSMGRDWKSALIVRDPNVGQINRTSSDVSTVTGNQLMGQAAATRTATPSPTTSRDWKSSLIVRDPNHGQVKGTSSVVSTIPGSVCLDDRSTVIRTAIPSPTRSVRPNNPCIVSNSGNGEVMAISGLEYALTYPGRLTCVCEIVNKFDPALPLIETQRFTDTTLINVMPTHVGFANSFGISDNGSNKVNVAWVYAVGPIRFAFAIFIDDAMSYFRIGFLPGGVQPNPTLKETMHELKWINDKSGYPQGGQLTTEYGSFRLIAFLTPGTKTFFGLDVVKIG